MDLEQVKSEAKRFGPMVWIGTVRPDGRPHVVPIAMNWTDDDELVGFVLTSGTKVRNLRSNPNVTLHWQVSEATGNDSLIVDGTARVVDDLEGRRTYWSRWFDCDTFEPGGPESDNHCFVVVRPERAVLLKMYGLAGRDTWRADAAAS